MKTKPHFDSFAEKISSDQKEILIRWLTKHSLKEVQEFVALPDPEGFGLEISISTLSRFYSSHRKIIAEERRWDLQEIAQRLRMLDEEDIYTRQRMQSGSTYLILERAFQLLNEPGLSVEQLKQLTGICKSLEGLRKTAQTRAQVLNQKSLDLQAEVITRANVAKIHGYDPEVFPLPIEYLDLDSDQPEEKPAREQPQNHEGEKSDLAA